MSRIEVDPALLDHTAARLREAVAVAVEVRRSRSSLAGLDGDAGHAGLSEAVDTFVDRWHHGLGLLVGDAEALATMLAGSGRVYLQVESAVAGAMSGAR